jgi:glycosyltransferase involved in cell wall biosynthesis
MENFVLSSAPFETQARFFGLANLEVDLKLILMLGTSFETMGGISAVVNIYRRSGLFERFPILYIASHTDGSSFKKLSMMFRALITVCRLIIKGRVGLMHVHIASNASFWRKFILLVPALSVNLPVILHLHGGAFDTFYENKCNRFQKWVVRMVFRRVERVIVLSTKWSDWVQQTLGRANVLVVGNPVEAFEWPGHVETTHVEILSLGRLTKKKGTYDLLQAAAMVAIEYPQLKLILCGDGELEQVQKEAVRLGIEEHIDIRGWVSGFEKQRLLARAAIFALPSYAEGLPISILEAMSAQLPVVSTYVGGIPEAITHGIEGYLITPGDVSTLSEYLKLLIGNESLRKKMGNAGIQKIATTFSTDCTIPKIEQIYNDFGYRAR